jgi:hypothetical protein
VKKSKIATGHNIREEAYNKINGRYRMIQYLAAAFNGLQVG